MNTRSEHSSRTTLPMSSIMTCLRRRRRRSMLSWMAKPYLPWRTQLWKIRETLTNTILISYQRILLESLPSQTCRGLTIRLNTIASSCRARATGLSSLRTKARRLGRCKIPWMMISTHQTERTSRWCQCLPSMLSHQKGWVPQPLSKRSKPRGY